MINKIEVEPDGIWKAVWKINTYEEYLSKIVPELFINDNAPQQVKDGFALAWKLLRQAYFEYQFIDVALTQSIITLERALRLKYDELNNKPKKNITLQKLLKWFLHNGYFEPTNPQIYDQLRLIRNGKVHDTNHSFGGIAFLSKVLTPLQLINDLYEDKELRKKRQEERKQLTHHFQEQLIDGGILHFGNQKLIIMGAWVAFVNNKSYPITLTVVVLPIFDPTPYLTNKTSSFLPIKLTLYNYYVGGGDILLEGINIETNESVKLTRIIEQINMEKFNSWKATAEPIIKEPFHLGLSVDSAISDLFLKRRECNLNCVISFFPFTGPVGVLV
ncbi:hypothetical protein [Pontibacter mangrovi]|uniref:Uncharacterized protein n=1 Tax=Pontibacter mangrovi TaxID=2589816 RepID=A0A501W148_9BACT|nr:hypothetical protein [Pontibacter mangrovi]TPE43349.1 hypothetical protein FJM65_14660 [Pontibacter mangrovi]